MSTIGSTRTRITGLAGFDTETMVRQLMNAESMKLNQLKQKSQLLTWQQDAYRGVSTSLKTFQDTFLNFANMSTNFKSQTMFSALKVSVTGKSGADIKGVSVKSTTGAQNTTATLKIDSFASKDTYVGNTYNTAVASDDIRKLKDDIKAGDSFDVTLNGKTEKLSVTTNDFKDGKIDVDALNTKIRNLFSLKQGDNNSQTLRFAKDNDDNLILRADAGNSFKIKHSEDSKYASITSEGYDISTLAVGDLEFTVGEKGIKISVAEDETDVTLLKKLNDALKGTNVSASLKDGKIKLTVTGDEDVKIDDSKSGLSKLGFNLDNDEITLTRNVATEPSQGILKVGDSFDISLDGKVTTVTLEDDDFNSGDSLDINALNSRLELLFGKDGNEAKVRFTQDDSNGALTLFTTSGHNIKISDSSASPKNSISAGNLNIEALAGGKLKFNVNTKEISVDIETGSSAATIVGNLNGEFQKEGMNISASVDDLGNIKLTATGNDQDITIDDIDGSMKKLGFNLDSNNQIKLTTRESTVQALGFTSGASNSETASSKLSDVFKGFYTFDGDGKATLKINGKEISVSKDDTIDSFVQKVNDSNAGVTMKFSKITNSFRIESNEMGSVNAINFTGSSPDFVEKALGFKDDEEGLSRITKASDAIIWIDGKQTSRSSNTFEIAEGLEVTLDPGIQSTNEIMTIKAAPDTESTIANIKKFIEEYNNLLDNLNNLYNQKREKSSTYAYYEPLTDDQKEVMSEKEIEKWEEKAKSGLLNNDPTLGKIISDLRSWVAEGVVLDDGSKISLYELGIDSNHWSDRGKLTIKDENKLRKALEERPDAVAALFNKESNIQYSDKTNRNTRMKEEGLAFRIDDIIQNAIKTSRDADGHRGTLIEKAGMKGTLSETENILYDALKDQDDRIYQMIEKLNSKEDYYYRMFSAMEQAMNKYNSQSSWLTQQFA